MFRNISALLLLLLFQSQMAHSQDGAYWKWNNGIGHSSWDLALEPEETTKLLALWESIGKDLETDRNELAGTYLKGGYDSGFFLRWSIKKGFVVIPYFDQNLITDFGYGTVRFVDNSAVFFIAERNLKGGRGLGKMPQKWTAIWGYFSPVESLEAFGTYRAGLGSFNEFNGDCCEFVPEFLVARIDKQSQPLPKTVPAKYRHFEKKPISGHIDFVGKNRSVKDWGFSGHLYQHWIQQAILTPVKVNVGRRDGVKRNMLFRMIGEPRVGRYLQVMRVGRYTSDGYIVREINDGNKGTYTYPESNQQIPLPRIRIGIKITTSPVID